MTILTERSVLADGVSIPRIGLGLWKVPNAEVEVLVDSAIGAGYQLFDCAQGYGNEIGLGVALAQHRSARPNLFVTTKVQSVNQGFQEAKESVYRSLEKLKLTYIDQVLIHWPEPSKNKYLSTWLALCELKREGVVRSIGVSNFQIEHIESIKSSFNEVPVVNQVEVHPLFQQMELRAYHRHRCISTISHSPLARGRILKHPVIIGLAQKYSVTPAQVVLRWHLQSDLTPLPKSLSTENIQQNITLSNFTLSKDDISQIANMNCASGRIGRHPND